MNYFDKRSVDWWIMFLLRANDCWINCCRCWLTEWSLCCLSQTICDIIWYYTEWSWEVLSDNVILHRSLEWNILSVGPFHREVRGHLSQWAAFRDSKSCLRTNLDVLCLMDEWSTVVLQCRSFLFSFPGIISCWAIIHIAFTSLVHTVVTYDQMQDLYTVHILEEIWAKCTMSHNSFYTREFIGRVVSHNSFNSHRSVTWSSHFPRIMPGWFSVRTLKKEKNKYWEVIRLHRSAWK